MALTPSQCRAARGLLGWQQDDLANAVDLSVNSISMFELGDRTPHESNRKKIRDVLENAGVIFIDRTPDAGPGVRLRK